MPEPDIKTIREPRGASVLFLLPVLLAVLAVNGWLGIEIHLLSKQRAATKRDYSVVNGITNGLLSVNVWRDRLRDVLSNRIKDFSLTKLQKEKVEDEISGVLETMITKADTMAQKSGFVKRIAVRLFVNWNDLRKRVPEFSHSILDELTRPAAKKALEKIAIQKMNELAARTRAGSVDTMRVQRLLSYYHTSSTAEFDSLAAFRIDSLQKKCYMFTFAMVGFMAILLLSWCLTFTWPDVRRLLLTSSLALAFIILVVGLMAPMIEIDARIKGLDFFLFGQHIQFFDQVIFFQSKSILDVTRILLATRKPDSMVVGALILVFSVVFPILKLLSTQLYLSGGKKIGDNPFVGFMVFKSGKWSMTDVMVLAIFMAFIGFRGILDNQLQHLKVRTPELTSIATNLTSLQPGFILFLSFVIYSLVLPEMLRRTRAEK